MNTCVVYGQQQSVTYGGKSSREFNQRYENHFGELVVTIGKKHTFLGMNINTIEDKKVDIYIKEQLLEAIEEFGENVDEK